MTYLKSFDFMIQMSLRSLSLMKSVASWTSLVRHTCLSCFSQVLDKNQNVVVITHDSLDTTLNVAHM